MSMIIGGIIGGLIVVFVIIVEVNRKVPYTGRFPIIWAKRK